MEIKTIGLLLLVPLFLGGCGYAALPNATQEKVTPSAIAGLWRYESNPRTDYHPTADGRRVGVRTNDAVVTIDLRADGTFDQIVCPNYPTNHLLHQGKWRIDGGYLRLNVLKPNFEARTNWVVEGAHWWIVESHRRGLKFAVFGAAEDWDPDSCYEFERIRQPASGGYHR